MFQPRTEVHTVKPEISGERVTDNSVPVEKNNQSCSLVLSMGTLVPKMLFWLAISQRSLVQVPTRSAIFFHPLKNVRSSVAWWLDSLMDPA